MKLLRDLAIAVFGGLLTTFVLAETGQKHLVTVLLLGMAAAAALLAMIVLVERRQWKLRVVVSELRSYLPGIHLSRRSTTTTPVEPEASPDPTESLIAEGEEFKKKLLVARRSTSVNPLGGSTAVNALARHIKDWNRRVAEAVDDSDLPFSTKMSLDIYNEPILGVVGVSAKRLAAVLENNLDMLYRLKTGYGRRGT